MKQRHIGIGVSGLDSVGEPRKTRSAPRSAEAIERDLTLVTNEVERHGELEFAFESLGHAPRAEQTDFFAAGKRDDHRPGRQLAREARSNFEQNRDRHGVVDCAGRVRHCVVVRCKESRGTIATEANPDVLALALRHSALANFPRTDGDLRHCDVANDLAADFDAEANQFLVEKSDGARRGFRAVRSRAESGQRLGRRANGTCVRTLRRARVATERTQRRRKNGGRDGRRRFRENEPQGF